MTRLLLTATLLCLPSAAPQHPRPMRRAVPVVAADEQPVLLREAPRPVTLTIGARRATWRT